MTTATSAAVLGLALTSLASALRTLGVDELEAAYRLWWCVPAIAAVLFLAARRTPARVAWPGVAEAREAGARGLDPVRAAGLALRAGALAALALVLAGPVAVHRAPPEPGRGLDLVLALDTSGSMRALDAQLDGQARTRLDLARAVVARFAERRVAEGDRVGLVVFGSSAFTQCPLTADGALLRASLERVRVGVAGESTALGDALALAVKRAAAADPSRPERTRPGAGRIVVLLTDGRSNAGGVPVDVATELAAGESIRVHTVGIGTSGERVPMATEAAAGRGLRFERHDLDPEALSRIAEHTGGRYFEATRPQDLEAVYGEIDALERVERRPPPRTRRAARPEPLLAIAAGLVALEILLTRVGWRRIP